MPDERLPNIRKICPCNVYPLEPHLFIENLGFAGVYLIFLFLIQNIHYGYSLEPPVFKENIKKSQIFPMKFSMFTAEKKILYIAWASFRNYCLMSDFQRKFSMENYRWESAHKAARIKIYRDFLPASLKDINIPIESWE